MKLDQETKNIKRKIIDVPELEQHELDLDFEQINLDYFSIGLDYE